MISYLKKPTKSKKASGQGFKTHEGIWRHWVEIVNSKVFLSVLSNVQTVKSQWSLRTVWHNPPYYLHMGVLFYDKVWQSTTYSSSSVAHMIIFL